MVSCICFVTITCDECLFINQIIEITEFQKSSLQCVLTYMCEGKACLSSRIHLTLGSDCPSALQKILLFEPSSSLVFTGGGRNFRVSVKHKTKHPRQNE